MKKRILILALAAALVLSLTAPACADITIPEVTMKEFEIPDNEAMAFLREMGIGWNLGNTMDAHADPLWCAPMDLEGAWCGVKTSQGVFTALKEAGFSTVRIPVSWHNHLTDDQFTIDEAWLSRVEQLVDWALDSGLYVIVNIHHDFDEKYLYPDSAHIDNSLRYMTAIWTQVAARFQDRDERLIMESMNEPRLVGTDVEWWFDPSRAECLDAADCINRLNQAFVDTVRQSGGYNATRYLMVPGYDASPTGADPAWFHLPEDDQDNRIIVSAHAYVPYSFALDIHGTSHFDRTSPLHTGDIGYAMNMLYDNYIAKGIPAVMGEFGALNKNNLQDRVDFTAYYVASATARGIPCLWWDNHAFDGQGENFGLLDRKTLTWPTPEILEALMKYKLD